MKKGTVWYLSDVVVAITSMMTVLFMLFIGALIIFVLNSQLEVNVIGLMLYSTPKADSILLTYLDSTAEKHPMKELLSYALLEGKTSITLEGREIDLKERSKELMEQITSKAYSLKITLGGEKVVLAQKGKPEAVPHIETETFVQAGKNREKLVLVIAK